MEFHWSMRRNHVFEVVLDQGQATLWHGGHRHVILEALSLACECIEARVLRVRGKHRLLAKLPVQKDQFLLGLPSEMATALSQADDEALARELAWRYRLADQETKVAIEEWHWEGDIHSVPPDEYVPTVDDVRKWVEEG